MSNVDEEILTSNHLLPVVLRLLLLNKCLRYNLKNVFVHKYVTQTDPLGIEFRAPTPHERKVEDVEQIFRH